MQRKHHGALLHTLLIRAGIGPTKAAEKIGVTRESIYNWYEDALFDNNRIQSICAGLDVSPGAFDQPFPTPPEVIALLKCRKKNKELQNENKQLRMQIDHLRQERPGI